MNMHFIYGVICGCFVGVSFGLTLFGFVARRVGKQPESSGYVAMSMVCRGALQKLESGDTGGVKQELTAAIANFYHSFDASSEQSHMRASVIASERRQIENLARSSGVLAAALTLRKTQCDKSVA
jgi:hypothetical protein